MSEVPEIDPQLPVVPMPVPPPMVKPISKTRRRLYRAERYAKRFAANIGPAVAESKLVVTEVMGAIGVLFGVGALTGWAYAAIIGGIAVIFAVERQPSKVEHDAGKAAAAVKASLIKAKGAGHLEVQIDDVIKAL